MFRSLPLYVKLLARDVWNRFFFILVQFRFGFLKKNSDLAWNVM